MKKQSFPSCYHTSRAPPRATATDKRDVRRLARLARVDSDARVTNSATRQSAFATRNSRVHPASHRALTPTPFDASLHASQPVRRHGVRLGSPTHQVGGARGGPRRYVARKRRARAPRRPKTLPRHPRRPDSPTAQHASTFHDVFFFDTIARESARAADRNASPPAKHQTKKCVGSAWTMRSRTCSGRACARAGYVVTRLVTRGRAFLSNVFSRNARLTRRSNASEIFTRTVVRDDARLT